MLPPRLAALHVPLVHPTLSALPTFAGTHENRAASGLKVGLCQHQRLVDPQPRAPEDHDQRPNPRAMYSAACDPHDGDDLLDPRRTSWIAPALIPWNAPTAIAGQR